jgi:predicted transcriptional regulator of viral defense system
MNNIEHINKLLKQGHGLILTSRAEKAGVSRDYLLRLADQGVLEHTARGVYVKAGEIDDQLYALQESARKIVYSHETALFIHRLTDRTPLLYSITVPSSYKPSAKLKEVCKVYFIKHDLIKLGAVEAPSGMGHTIAVYNRERTICDILRSRGRLDPQIVTDALKRYVLKKKKDLNLLGVYAQEFGVQRLLHQYLEVLL